MGYSAAMQLRNALALLLSMLVVCTDAACACGTPGGEPVQGHHGHHVGDDMHGAGDASMMERGHVNEACAHACATVTARNGDYLLIAARSPDVGDPGDDAEHVHQTELWRRDGSATAQGPPSEHPLWACSTPISRYDQLTE